MGFAASDVNLYRFVGNNATNYTDPTGLQKGGLGNSQAAFETLILARYKEGMSALKRATGKWAEDARLYSEELMKKYPKLTKTQRLGIQNAVRHLYWMMIITARYDEGLATQIGNMHEYGEYCLDSLIDQFHNSLARQKAPKIHTKISELIGPFMAQFELLGKVPGGVNYEEIWSKLMESAWMNEEEKATAQIKAIIDKLVEESAKDPLNGPLIIDIFNDTRIKNLPGWKQDMPPEHFGGWMNSHWNKSNK